MKIFAALRRYLRREEGNVTMDFVICLPVILMILLASFEAGFATIRKVWLERALDLTVRDLRVGVLGSNPGHDLVRERFCSLAFIMPDCLTDLRLEMNVIDRTTWAGLDPTPTCVDRTIDIQPYLDFVQGGSNELVAVRACAVFNPTFPTTPLGLQLRLDDSGGYQLAAMSVFVNEPR
ncbi:TadE/TadG family type IV pilus assembly protein [Falsigemmobacter faecalis]|uniref:Pilus assembly protein n=1 Tax=Falsigemmobacter faecalis TaxID=2488730 RepID=A0A3P3DQK3_9RHOB|nr:TadE family protein [Falsigemmobacter faecalis]RRH76431.1 pilus assembly protein [Falsigemmobacter faecalis]